MDKELFNRIRKTSRAKSEQVEVYLNQCQQLIQHYDLTLHDLMNHQGLNRVRTPGADSFARTVVLSVLTLYIHRIGQLLLRKQKKHLRFAT